MEKKPSNEIVFSMVAMFVITAIALILYFYKFNGQLSNIPSDWGDFGSYLNGVLSPMLLFLTLICLVKTLQVQKDVQTNQKREFETANKNQEKQIEELKKAHQQQQVAALRTELVKFINIELSIEEKHNLDLNNRLQTIVKKGFVDGNEEREVKSLTDKLQGSFDRRLNLRNIAASLIGNNFNTEHELREHFNNRYQDMIKTFGKIYI